MPLQLSLKDDGAALPGAHDTASPASRESYSISVRREGIKIAGASSAGIFYGVQTLFQLVEGDSLPVVDVKDWPSLPYRGFMMDMSHGGILTVAEVEQQLDQLARWKANQYFFYVETDLDMPGYPLLHKESNWSADDIRTIVAYAAQRHIDVVPCVELFGHLHDLFRIEKYSGMAALPHGGEGNPSNASLDYLLATWLRSYASLFPSKWIHIGFDEPFELERAGSAAAGGVSPDTLWLRHLQNMAQVSAEMGKRPIFWADIDEGAYIFNKYPGLAAGLPKDAVAAPWFYDARDSYSNLLDLFSANHVPILVASGISDWDNIAPDFESSFINIDGFLAAGRKAGTLGLINTEWSDSALALHREAKPALAYGAVAAWQSEPVDRASFFDEYAAITENRDDAPKIAAALRELATSQALLLKALGSETSFRMFDDAFLSATLQRAKQTQPQLRASRLAAEAAEEQLLLTDKGNETATSLLLAARMLDYVGMKYLYAVEIAANFDALPAKPSKDDVQYLLKREGAARNHSRVGDMIDLSGELQTQYRDEWLRQYKPYRLATAVARWDAEQQSWIRFQQNIWYITRNFKTGDERPTLQQVLTLR